MFKFLQIILASMLPLSVGLLSESKGTKIELLSSDIFILFVKKPFAASL